MWNNGKLASATKTKVIKCKELVNSETWLLTRYSGVIVTSKISCYHKMEYPLICKEYHDA